MPDMAPRSEASKNASVPVLPGRMPTMRAPTRLTAVARNALPESVCSKNKKSSKLNTMAVATISIVCDVTITLQGPDAAATVTAGESSAFCGAKKPGPQRHFCSVILRDEQENHCDEIVSSLKFTRGDGRQTCMIVGFFAANLGGARAAFLAFRRRSDHRLGASLPGHGSRHHRRLDNLDDRPRRLDRDSLFQGSGRRPCLSRR